MNFAPCERHWYVLQQQQQDAAGFPFVVRLSFYEARTKQGLVRPYQEKVFWEVWRIHLRLVGGGRSAAGALSSLSLCSSRVG
jgi:hypothetical protein